MRKFRTAAIAVTSAVALTISGTAVASAQNNNTDTGSAIFTDGVEGGYSYTDTLSTITDGISSGKSLHEIGGDLGAYTKNEDGTIEIKDRANAAWGADLFGSEKDVANEAPEWAKFWRDSAILGVIGTVIGGIIYLLNTAAFSGVFQGYRNLFN